MSNYILKVQVFSDAWCGVGESCIQETRSFEYSTDAAQTLIEIANSAIMNHCRYGDDVIYPHKVRVSYQAKNEPYRYQPEKLGRKTSIHLSFASVADIDSFMADLYDIWESLLAK